MSHIVSAPLIVLRLRLAALKRPLQSLGDAVDKGDCFVCTQHTSDFSLPTTQNVLCFGEPRKPVVVLVTDVRHVGGGLMSAT